MEFWKRQNGSMRIRSVPDVCGPCAVIIPNWKRLVMPIPEKKQRFVYKRKYIPRPQLRTGFCVQNSSLHFSSADAITASMS